LHDSLNGRQARGGLDEGIELKRRVQKKKRGAEEWSKVSSSSLLLSSLQLSDTKVYAPRFIGFDVSNKILVGRF